jgi:hypothetical protein
MSFRTLRFVFTLAIGAALGAFVASNLDDRQRARFVTRAKRAATTGRTADVATTVSAGVGDIADAATGRVTGAIDTATSAVTHLIAVDDPAEHAEHAEHA